MCTERNQDDRLNHMIITGHPGSGKSSFVWTFCCWYAHQGHRIRWVRLIPMIQGALEVIFDKNSLVVNKFANVSELPTRLDERFDLYVVDGMNNQIGFPNFDMHRVVFVASMHLKLSPEVRYLLWPEILQSISWSLNEYKLACLSDSLWNTVSPFMVDIPEIPKSSIGCLSGFESSEDDQLGKKIDEELRKLNDSDRAKIKSRVALIEKKYYFAGRNVRFMFDFSFKMLEYQFNDSLKAGSNFEQLMNGLKNSITSDSAVNDLFAQFFSLEIISVNDQTKEPKYQKKYFSLPVSEYIHLKIIAQHRKQFIIAATQHVQTLGISSLDDWILQLDVLYRLVCG